MNSVVLFPVNLYGPRDNFDLETSHVIPAMIRKFVDARERGARPRSCCGATARRRASSSTSRTPPRGILLAAERYDSSEPVNLGTGIEISHPRSRDADRAGRRLHGAVRLGHDASRTASRGAGSTSRAPASASASSRRRLVREGLARTGRRTSKNIEKEIEIDEARTHHGHHGPGRLVPRGAPAREGLRGARASCAARARSTPSASTASTKIRTSADYRLRLVYGDLDDAARSTASCARSSPTRSTTSARRATCASASTCPSTRRRPSRMGTLRLLEAMRESGLDKTAGSTRRRRARCSARRRRRRTRARRSSRAARTRAPRCSRTSSARTTARPTACSSRCGILFNHESPRRGIPFVTRKITRAAARIKHGLEQEALPRQPRRASATGASPGDYVEAMWLMLQQDKPDDFVIATGESHTVRELLDVAFGALGPRLEEVRRDRSALLPPDRGRPPARRSHEGARVLGWKPKVTLQGA